MFYNPNSSDFYNIGPSLVMILFTYQYTIGLESGSMPTFILFAIPAVVFTILAYLPVKYPMIPNRVVSIVAFGIGVIIILKQFPNAFGYLPRPEMTFGEAEPSFLALSSWKNWTQLLFALCIPAAALIGHRFKQGALFLLIASVFFLILGYARV